MNAPKFAYFAAVLSLFSAVQAGTVTFEDFDFTLKIDSLTVSSGVYEARWGTYSGGVFTPFGGVTTSSASQGYLDAAGPELSVVISQGDNISLTAGLQLALAITTLADDANYSSSAPQLILTDEDWLVPTFTAVTPELIYHFSSSTIALKGGTYAYNGGNETLTVTTSAIPEPSSFAALAGLGMLGFAAMRKRRSA